MELNIYKPFILELNYTEPPPLSHDIEGRQEDAGKPCKIVFLIKAKFTYWVLVTLFYVGPYSWAHIHTEVKFYFELY